MTSAGGTVSETNKNEDNKDAEKPRKSTKDEADDNVIVLHPIAYKGVTATFETGPGHNHLYSVIFRLIKDVYVPQSEPIRKVLPSDLDEIDDKNIPRIIEVINSYNRCSKTIRILNDSLNPILGDWGLPYCTEETAIKLLNLIYDCAISSPMTLNKHYKSFTSEVYGETNVQQMAILLKELNLGPNDVFVDLGSGVGNLVLFTSAFIKVKKVIGIENSPFPSMKAEEMQRYFEKMMAHFGKSYSPYEIHSGDFTQDDYVKLVKNEATVIFMNNYAFSPDLMEDIKKKLIVELNDGVRIVTTKQFGVKSREINGRNCQDVQSYLKVSEMTSIENGVSWTANPVPFYLHVVDRMEVYKFLYDKDDDKDSGKEKEKEKGKEMKRKDKEGSSDSSSSNSSNKDKKQKKKNKDKERKEKVKVEQHADPSTSANPVAAVAQPKIEDDDTVFYGRTTRQMWKAQVGMTEAKKQEPDRNEPDREYVPPLAKKSSKKAVSEKKKKIPPTPKTPKQLQSASSSQPTISSPPPMSTSARTIEVKTEVKNPLEKIDADTMSVINRMHETTMSIPQLKHPVQEEVERGELVCVPLHQPPLPAAPPPTPQIVQQQPQQQPQQQQSLPKMQQQQPMMPVQLQNMVQPQVIPAQNLNSVPDVEQRHTFMIPPTDPMYQLMVTFYLDFKSLLTKAQQGDADLITQLNKEIEHEKARNADLNESIQTTQQQIDEALSRGVVFLKERLHELDMSNVQEVAELLYGSKQIVAMHKSLTQKMASLEAAVALEEQRTRQLAGEKALEFFDLAEMNSNFDVEKLVGQIHNWNNNGVVDEPLDQNVTSPVGGSSRKNRARQRTAANAKRANSNAGKTDEPAEIEKEIKQFVEKALKLDKDVKDKEKEKRTRGGGGASSGPPEKIRKGSVNAGVALPPTVAQNASKTDLQQLRSGPLISQ